MRRTVSCGAARGDAGSHSRHGRHAAADQRSGQGPCHGDDLVWQEVTSLGSVDPLQPLVL